MVTWPARVAPGLPIEDHLECYRLLFPGKTVSPCIFSNLPAAGDDHEGMNGYVADRRAGTACRRCCSPSRWSAEEVERRVRRGASWASRAT